MCCHGDLAPVNAIYDASSEKLRLIDPLGGMGPLELDWAAWLLFENSPDTLSDSLAKLAEMDPRLSLIALKQLA